MSVISTEDYLAKATQLIEQEDFEEALYACSQAISVNPENVVAYITRANIRIKTSKYEEALRDFDKAIEINPLLIEAYLGRAKIKRRKPVL